MKNKSIRMPGMIALVLALIAVIAFFLPHISATEEYKEYIAAFKDETIYESSDLTVGDLEHMSLYTYAKVYIQSGEEIFHSAAGGYVTGGVYLSVGVFALLTALAAWRKKPLPTFLMNACMGGAFYFVNWDILSRGIMPDSDRMWGMAYYLYYPIAGLIAIAAIWMLAAKIQMKKQKQ